MKINSKTGFLCKKKSLREFCVGNRSKKLLHVDISKNVCKGTVQFKEKYTIEKLRILYSADGKILNSVEEAG